MFVNEVMGFRNEACPWLPSADEVLDHRITRRHGGERHAQFYQDALRYAQSQWRAGKPAQALLQLDKAWMVPPGVVEDNDHVAAPYRALVWILFRSQTGDCGYLGNPVRHFQHLASRMSGPWAEVRSWRAWICLYLSERVLAGYGFSRDGRQIAREGLWVPRWWSALAGLAKLGWSAEARLAADALVSADGAMANSREIFRKTPQHPVPFGV